MKNIFIKYQDVIISLLLIIICLFAILPLIHSGFFPIHDDEQMARLYELHKVLGDGQIPPRWVPDLGFGYGFPLYNFYPPLFYYLGEVFYSVTSSLILSTKIVLILGFVASAGFMYLWVKNRFGRLAGLFAAVLYTYAPYHSIDIYVRGAFSEFFSFVFIPAVLWSFDKLAKKFSYGNILVTGILLSLVVLTHNLVAMQAIPFFILYFFFLLIESHKNLVQKLVAFSMSGIISLGLSAYFWLPALSEKKYTLVDSILTKELANYTIHFVCPQQLWSSAWGYGGSVAGCFDGLSFELGKMHILLAIAAVILLGILVISKKIIRSEILSPLMGILFLGLSIFMTTNYSSILWKLITPFAYIQFPWRFLLFSALFSSFLGGFVVYVLQKTVHRRLTLGFVVICSMLVLWQVRNDFHPQRYMLVGDDHYLSDITTRISRMSYEYVPKEVATRKSALGTTELAIDENMVPKQSFAVIKGSLDVKQLRNKSQDKQYSVQAHSVGVLQINTFSFPGWNVIVDGQKVRYNDTNRLHLIQIPLQPGNHTVHVLFTNTPVRTYGNLISLITLIGIGVSGLYDWRRKKYE